MQATKVWEQKVPMRMHDIPPHPSKKMFLRIQDTGFFTGGGWCTRESRNWRWITQALEANTERRAYTQEGEGVCAPPTPSPYIRPCS